MSQPGLLAPVPTASHRVVLRLAPGASAARVLEVLAALEVDEGLVIGLGPALVAALGAEVPGLRAFPALTGPGVDVPSTQADLWLWARAESPGDAFDRARATVAALGADVRIVDDVACFLFRGGRDLSGFEDGTENPKGEAAVQAALVDGQGPGLDGGSFVAVQRWVHAPGALAAMSDADKSEAIGRDLDTNEELADAPPSAHVKRTAQESFEPPAFVLRRSMPWGDLRTHGLDFVAFGADLDRFERQLRRMVGEEDGIVDAVFRFSTPVTGGYYWCPPARGGRLDLRALRS